MSNLSGFRELADIILQWGVLKEEQKITMYHWHTKHHTWS